jgi:hypothetical protein
MYGQINGLSFRLILVFRLHRANRRRRFRPKVGLWRMNRKGRDRTLVCCREPPHLQCEDILRVALVVGIPRESGVMACHLLNRRVVSPRNDTFEDRSGISGSCRAVSGNGSTRKRRQRLQCEYWRCLAANFSSDRLSARDLGLMRVSWHF